MTNEIVESKQDLVEVVDSKPNYNKKTGDVVIPIAIKCKRIKNDKVNFNAVSALMYLPVIKDGVDIGYRNRWINVHFTKEAFKTADKACDITSVEDLRTGTLYVMAKGVQAPNRYEVTENDETGEVEYPEIWIREGIMGFEPYTVSAESFSYHKTEKTIEATVEPTEATFDVSDEN